jgi:hypothetical protein
MIISFGYTASTPDAHALFSQLTGVTISTAFFRFNPTSIFLANLAKALYYCFCIYGIV